MPKSVALPLSSPPPTINDTTLKQTTITTTTTTPTVSSCYQRFAPTLLLILILILTAITSPGIDAVAAARAPKAKVAKHWQVDIRLPECVKPDSDWDGEKGPTNNNNDRCLPTRVFECSTEGEEILRLEALPIIGEHFPRELFSSASPPPLPSPTRATLRLHLDKTGTHSKVFHTRMSVYNRAERLPINRRVFYNDGDEDNDDDMMMDELDGKGQQKLTQHSSPQQFKSILEFYGTIGGDGDGDGDNTSYHIRGMVKVFACHRLLVWAFFRRGEDLYQLMPEWLAREQPWNVTTEEVAALGNRHRLIRVARGLPGHSRLFTEHSSAFHGRQLHSHKHYCDINIVVDEPFYVMMNQDPSLVVIYVQLNFMLANEIAQQIDSKNKYATPSVHINLTIDHKAFGNLPLTLDRIQYLMDRWMTGEDSRWGFCLAHFFTGKQLSSHDDQVQHGWALKGGLEDERENMRNYGITSIHGCDPRPWSLACWLTFAHELFHNLGSGHDHDYLEEEEVVEGEEEEVVEEPITITTTANATTTTITKNDVPTNTSDVSKAHKAQQPEPNHRPQQQQQPALYLMHPSNEVSSVDAGQMVDWTRAEVPPSRLTLSNTSLDYIREYFEYLEKNSLLKKSFYSGENRGRCGNLVAEDGEECDEGIDHHHYLYHHQVDSSRSEYKSGNDNKLDGTRGQVLLNDPQWLWAQIASVCALLAVATLAALGCARCRDGKKHKVVDKAPNETSFEGEDIQDQGQMMHYDDHKPTNATEQQQHQFSAATLSQVEHVLSDNGHRDDDEEEASNWQSNHHNHNPLRRPRSHLEIMVESMNEKYASKSSLAVAAAFGADADADGVGVSIDQHIDHTTTH